MNEVYYVDEWKYGRMNDVMEMLFVGGMGGDGGYGLLWGELRLLYVCGVDVVWVVVVVVVCVVGVVVFVLWVIVFGVIGWVMWCRMWLSVVG